MAHGTVISAAVEGIVDEAVVRTVIAHAGAAVGDVYGKQGKEYLRQKLAGYNNAARRSPWIVLVNLDREEECAPPLLNAWLAQPARHLCFRVAVREVEAWLMADVERLCRSVAACGSGEVHPSRASEHVASLVGATAIGVDPCALPDPCDPNCPPEFKSHARLLLSKVQGNPGPADEHLRKALLKFIAEFSSWDLASNRNYLEVSRAIIKAAHGEEPPSV